MNMNRTNWPAWALGVYVAMAIVCFGPAMVQSETAMRRRDVECRATNGLPRDVVLCRLGGPTFAEGAPKAALWPFWLSYTIADSIAGTDR
ncbi:MAG: hypothetical protein ABI574_04745 [Burkholderiales bacterium]